MTVGELMMELAQQLTNRSIGIGDKVTVRGAAKIYGWINYSDMIEVRKLETGEVRLVA